MATQWVTFRTTSALLHAPLSSAVANGEGWRAVALPQYHSLEVLDNWVIDTAHKSVASLGISAAGEVAYVVAVSESSEPLRFVLGVNAAPPSHEAMLRAEVDTLELDAWTARVTERFSAWSAHAPQEVDARQVARWIRIPDGDGEATATALFAALGLDLPEAPPVSLADLQAQARERLEQQGPEKKERSRKNKKK